MSPPAAVSVSRQTARPGSRRRHALAWAVCALAGLLLAGAAHAGLWLFDHDGYLALQALSDPVHRLVLLGLPAATGLLVLCWMFAELGRLRRWLSWLGRGLAAVSLALLAGLPAFVVGFDLRLESRGLQGQLVHHASGRQPRAPRSPRGPWREASAAAPNLLVPGLADGDALTLDRRTLARKRPDGSFAWHIERPGPPPAALRLAGGRIHYSGPGPRYEDDVVLAVIELASGRRLWSYHCLGNGISPPAFAGRQLALVSWRPANAAVHLIERDGPAVRWALRLDDPVRLEPRFGPAGLEVAAGETLIRIDPASGRIDGRLAACGRRDVACRDGRVVAWERGGGH